MKKNGMQILLLVFAICLISCKDSQFSTNLDPIPPAGTPDPLHKQCVTQSLADPMLDILIVIDTSGSMEHHQQKLGDKLGQLIDNLNGINWQIAFTSTDNAHPVINSDGYNGVFYNLEDSNGELTDASGKKIKVLDASLPNPDTIFANTVNRAGKSERCNNDVCEDTGTEAPLLSIVNAIGHRNTDNAGFFRADATFATIILSNENEFSNGQPVEGTNSNGEAVTIEPTTSQDVVNEVSKVFGSNKRFVAYGIIIQNDDPQCLADEGDGSGRESPSYGTFIENLANATKGKTGSICDADYTANLTDFGEHLEDQLTLKEFALDHKPVEGTIQVTFDNTPINSGWVWNALNNVVKFDTPPTEGTEVCLAYQRVN